MAGVAGNALLGVTIDHDKGHDPITGGMDGDLAILDSSGADHIRADRTVSLPGPWADHSRNRELDLRAA